MDSIAEQLKSEIQSLREYIHRTQDQLLAAGWIADLLDPLERVEDDLTTDELRTVLKALYQARNRFGVNGQLAGTIDEILNRHEEIVAEISANEDSRSDRDDGMLDGVLLNAEETDGVAIDADGLFEDEEDEVDVERGEAEPDTEGARTDDLFDDNFDAVDSEQTDDEGAAEGDEYGEPVDSALFEGSEPVDPMETAGVEAEPLSGVDGVPGDTDGLFDLGNEAQTPAAPGSMESTADSAKQPPPHKAIEKASKVRDRSAGGKDDDGEASYNVLAHTVSLDDIQAALDISIPRQDVTALEQKLRTKLEDRVLASLSANKMMERQYILIPRISRFGHGGKTMPCTVVNLARTFASIFGDLRDLARYRQHELMSHEVPEPGWALVTAECPRESLDKSFMEQNQYLRYLATNLGIPSHFVRRRSLSEAIYDVIVGRLVLGETLQRQTLDWTSSGPTKTDFICIYSAEDGIRVRDMSRTTRHGSIGVCPNW